MIALTCGHKVWTILKTPYVDCYDCLLLMSLLFCSVVCVPILAQILIFGGSNHFLFNFDWSFNLECLKSFSSLLVCYFTCGGARLALTCDSVVNSIGGTSGSVGARTNAVAGSAWRISTSGRKAFALGACRTESDSCNDIRSNTAHLTQWASVH